VSAPKVTVVPVAKMDPAELEAAAARVSKVLNAPVELREAARIPRGSEDVARGQHLAPVMLAALRSELVRLKTSKQVGSGAAPAPGGVTVFVTDVDLFTASTAAVIVELDAAHHAALLSVRRLREAFYRRGADPGKQRSRLVKAILRATARLSGLHDCSDPGCALAPTQAVVDLDRKSERYCAACWKRLSSGIIRI